MYEITKNRQQFLSVRIQQDGNFEREPLTLETTVFPFSDRCLSTYAEDRRSLEAERRDKRLEFENVVFFPPFYSSVTQLLRVLVCSVCSAELQSISAANYEQHTRDEAISSTQTQLQGSSPRGNEHVFVYLKNKGRV